MPANYVAPVATGQGALAVGSGAVASGQNSVALGNDSSDGGRAGVVSVGAPGQERQITNVAPGVAGTDAVNVNQLSTATTHLQSQINGLDSRVTTLGKQLSGGIAASAAMAVVTPVEPGRYHLTGAVAAYNGQVGVGMNLLKRSENGQTTLHGGVGWGSGGSKPIVRVGFGFSFD